MAASPAPEAIPWSRPDYDLDDHAAAWTDVDGCAGDPILAQRRNGDAAGEMARACVTHGVHLVLVSTNEVFDGRRTDGEGYDRFDDPNPINPYGFSKVAGETAPWQAFAAEGAPKLAIVRTAWLFGPPGDDFPSKILAAAERADAAGGPLRVVADESGTPTSAARSASCGARAGSLASGSPRPTRRSRRRACSAGSTCTAIRWITGSSRAGAASWPSWISDRCSRGVGHPSLRRARWPSTTGASSPPAWPP